MVVWQSWMPIAAIPLVFPAVCTAADKIRDRLVTINTTVCDLSRHQETIEVLLDLPEKLIYETGHP